MNYSSEGGVLFNKAKTSLIIYPAGKTNVSYSIPSGVTTVESRAFKNCISLTSITVPSSVTLIYAYSSFEGCSSLVNIIVDGGNSNYSSESGILFDKDGTSLLFYPAGKTNESYVVPSEVTRLAYAAFKNCVFLTNITIPSTVTFINSYMFYGCTSLTSVVIPSGVTEIGEYSFYECTALTNITLPENLTRIYNYAFEKCSALTSITLPESVVTIGYGAFSSCTALTSVTILSTVTRIEGRAFENCSSLTDVTILSNNVSIGDYIFSLCSSLTSVTIQSTTPPTLGAGVFNEIDCQIYVPAESVSAYQAAAGWSDYSSRIQAIVEG